VNLIRQLFARRRHTDDLALEIQAHLEEQIDDLVARGMPRNQAIAAAHRAFGNVTHVAEASRDVWAWPTLDSFVQDVRYALRQMGRHPALAAAAILTLAVGVAANTTVFSWTRAVLLHALPGATDPARIVTIESLTQSGDWTPTSVLDFRDLRDHTSSFVSMAAAYPTAFAVGDETSTERRYGEVVSSTFFDVLGVKPEVGRLFDPSERDEVPGTHPVVVLSHDVWTGRYHNDPAIIGSTIRINRYPFTVIGVAPEGFYGSLPGTEQQMWVPVSMLGQLDPNGAGFLRDRKTRMFRVLGRLAPGVTMRQARDEVQTLASRIAAANASTNAGMSATVLPIWQSHYGVQDSLRAPLLILSAACGLLLLIVCANLANLLLTRAATRRKELGLRLALGAPRGRLLRQLVTEAAVLSVVGSMLGLVATAALSGSLELLVPSFAAPNLVQPTIDGAVLAFTLALACGVTLLAGIAPALHGARENLTAALNEASRGTTAGAHTHHMRGALVAGEVALALVALIGAGLFVKSLRQLQQVEPGFDPRGVAIGRVSLSAAGFDAAHADAFLQAVRYQLTGEPGVTSVSYADYVPLSLGAGSWEDLDVEDYTPAPGENMKLYRAGVAPGYFEVMKIGLAEGRDFSALDDSAHAPSMIVNQAFVRHFFAGRSAIGRKVRGWGRWFTIVGVARDSKIDRLSEPATPYFYVPIRQIYRPEFPFTFLVRTNGPVEAAVTAIRRDIRAADPAIPVFGAMSLETYIAAPLSQVQRAAQLLGVVAAIAFLLAAVGLYGIMADAVAQRTREISIRLAMGSRRSNVALMVARQAGRLLAVGLVLGVAVGAALGRLVSAILYGVRPADPTVFASALICMLMVALVATAIPAYRAMRVDPMVALRDA
jgi:predicted permease